MSKTVTIPEGMYPFWECELNGVKYSYKAGTSQSVPDEVAALIEANNAMAPVENPPLLDTAEYDFSGIEIDTTAVSVESVMPMDEYLAIIGTDYHPAITAKFAYNNNDYSVNGYQVENGNIHFVAHIDGDSGIASFVDLIITKSSGKVKAKYVVTDYPTEEATEEAAET